LSAIKVKVERVRFGWQQKKRAVAED